MHTGTSLIVTLISISYGHTACGETTLVTGTVEPVPTLHFCGSPQNGFPVSKINVSIGDRVSPNQVLLELDPAPLLVQYREAQLTAAKVSLERNEIAYGIARRVVDRTNDLRNDDPNFVSEQEFDREIGRAEQESTSMRLAKANVEAAQAQLNMAKYQYRAYAHMRSPISGVVTKLTARLGFVARPEQETVVWVEVINLSKVQAKFLIPVKRAQKLRQKIGQPIKIQCNNETHSGTLQSIGHIVEAEQVELVLWIDNPDEKLLPGMKVLANLSLK